MRIDKYLSNLNYGTRKDIKEFVRKKLVKVNNKIIKRVGFIINIKEDIVKLDDVVIENKGIVYLMLNKPKDYVCANSDNLSKTVLDLIKEPYNRLDLKIAGRLDKDTTGLVLLSNDGKFIHNIISPKKDKTKEYIVTLLNKFEDKYIELLKHGIVIKNKKEIEFLTKSAQLIKVSDNQCRIIITEGKYHQVKRMFEKLGNEVTELHRVKIGNLDLLDLEEGEYIEVKKENI